MLRRSTFEEILRLTVPLGDVWLPPRSELDFEQPDVDYPDYMVAWRIGRMRWLCKTYGWTPREIRRIERDDPGELAAILAAELMATGIRLELKAEGEDR